LQNTRSLMNLRRAFTWSVASISLSLATLLPQGCAQGVNQGDGTTVGGNATGEGDADGGPDVRWTAVPNGQDPGDATTPLDAAATVDAVYDVAFDSYVLPEGAANGVDSGSCPTGLGEDCTNGIDDNCNGLVDCADPLCSAYSCDEAPPPGWQGPIGLYTGSGSPLPPPPSCGAPYANDFVDGNAGLVASTAQCGCSCGSVSGADCDGAIGWTVYTDANCSNPCTSAAMPPSTATFCESTSACSVGSFQVTAGAPLLNIASCHANPSIAIPNCGWQTVGRGCGYSGPVDHGGCSGGALCVQRPTSPFNAKACVFAAGDLTCPAGSYSVGQTFYAAASDSRGCSACTCGSPTGVTCALSGNLSTYATFGSPTCSNVTATATASPNGACTMVEGGAAGVEGYVTASPSGGACAPSSVGATGSVTPTGPVTVCCEP